MEEEKMVTEQEHEMWLIKLLKLIIAFIFFPWFLRGKVRVATAKKNLDKKVEKRKDWDKTCSQPDNLFSEDDLVSLKHSIKHTRKLLNEMRAERNKADKPQEYKNRINDLNNLLCGEEAELAEKKKKQEDRVAGIKLAELEAVYNKRKRQYNALFTLAPAWSLLFIVIALLTFAISAFARFLPENLHPTWIHYLLTAVFFVAISARILSRAYRPVPEKQEWIMEFFGKYLTTWDAGLHFMFPFYLSRKGRVYMADQGITLYLDTQMRNGKISAKVDFANASAEIIVELFFRIFDSYRAMYEIDNAISSISEKMESGIRAYYGNIGIDEAIEQRADVELRSIIVQDATEAAIFKNWGVLIRSLAVTDIKLPPEVEAQRIRKLEAEKSFEVAGVVRETAKIEAETLEIQGSGRGRNLKGLKGGTGARIKIEDVIKYDIAVKKYEAYGKARILIAHDSPTDSPALAGATAGAAAKVGTEAATE